METKKHEDRFRVVADKVLKNSYFILDNRYGILLGPYGRDAFEKAEDLNSVVASERGCSRVLRDPDPFSCMGQLTGSHPGEVVSFGCVESNASPKPHIP